MKASSDFKTDNHGLPNVWSFSTMAYSLHTVKEEQSASEISSELSNDFTSFEEMNRSLDKLFFDDENVINHCKED